MEYGNVGITGKYKLRLCEGHPAAAGRALDEQTLVPPNSDSFQYSDIPLFLSPKIL
jgi:hypothetical protein